MPGPSLLLKMSDRSREYVVVSLLAPQLRDTVRPRSHVGYYVMEAPCCNSQAELVLSCDKVFDGDLGPCQRELHWEQCFCRTFDVDGVRIW